MDQALQALLSLLPIGLAGVLLLGLRTPARRAMPWVYAAAVGLALFAWSVPWRVSWNWKIFRCRRITKRLRSLPGGSFQVPAKYNQT